MLETKQNQYFLSKSCINFIGAQRYVVQYRERNAATEYLEVESTTTDIIVRELQSGLWYEFMVISVGARGRRNEQGSAILHLQTGISNR